MVSAQLIIFVGAAIGSWISHRTQLNNPGRAARATIFDIDSPGPADRIGGLEVEDGIFSWTESTFLALANVCGHLLFSLQHRLGQKYL